MAKKDVKNTKDQQVTKPEDTKKPEQNVEVIEYMGKDELVKDMAERATEVIGTTVSQKLAKACLDAFIAAVETNTEAGVETQLIGFGTFKITKRAARVGRHPQTKEEINIPETWMPAFKPGINLKNKAELFQEKITGTSKSKEKAKAAKKNTKSK